MRLWYACASPVLHVILRTTVSQSQSFGKQEFSVNSSSHPAAAGKVGHGHTITTSFRYLDEVVDTSILRTGRVPRYLVISPLGIMLSPSGSRLSRKRFSGVLGMFSSESESRGLRGRPFEREECGQLH